jgi:DNA primase
MPGRILEEDMQQVRERTDLVEVISGFTQLKKAGRVFKGLCPFHQEKTPSFTVDPARQLYYCFGCGAGGDVFTFLRQTEGLTFSEAAERLANRLGIPLRHEGGGERADGTSRRTLLSACAAAAEYFADLLTRSPEAARARKYLEGRGFASEDGQAWKLGYAPAGRDTLYRHLLGRRFTPEQIQQAGLVLVTEGGEHRDRFRGRLIFPIADVSGDVVGFGARALGDEQPKYLNSPETSLYHKSRMLYGLERAKTGMVRGGFAVVTEGYTDVIALSKVGVANAVATCGTALGEEHLAIIKRFCDRVVLAFDADAAGAHASERAFGIHEKVGLEVLVAPLPPGKDPADVALTQGADAVRGILEGAVPLMRFVLEEELSRHRLDTPEGKARAVRAGAAALAWEPNLVARGQHAFWLARRVGVDDRQVEQVLREVAEARKLDPGAPSRPSSARLPGHLRVEREALALLLDAPAERDRALEWMVEDHFTQPEHRVLLEALRTVSRNIRPRSISEELPDEDTRRLAAELAMTPVTAEAAEEVFLRLEEFRLQRQIESLRATLDRLDPAGEADRHDAVFRELVRLEERRRRFDDRRGG